jgi:ribose transport system substrate-binding protein
MRRTRSTRWTLLRLPVTILVLTLLTLGPAFGAFAQDATPAAKPGEGLFFTFANATASGPLFVGMQEGVQKAADAAGVEIKLYNNNFDGETALRNAQLMVQDQPDFIIMYNAVEGVGARIGKTFNDAGIPCIAVNVPFPGCAWFNLSNKDIGTDTGKVAAEAAKAKGWTGDDTTVILVQNATAGEEVNHSVMYYYEAVAQNMPGMDQIAATDITRQATTMGDNLIQVDGQSALEPSYTAVKNVLPTIPEGRHILIQTPNDDSAMGAWRAIVEANRVDDALITGLGGGEEGLKQLRENPNWVAEGDIFFPFWGQYLVAMALEMQKGDVPPERTAAPQIVLTKETVDQYYPEGATTPAILPALTAENEYLADSELLKMLDNIEGIND